MKKNNLLFSLNENKFFYLEKLIIVLKMIFLLYNYMNQS